MVRAELVDAALRAIERCGASVSMDDIAAEAGASKPKLYRHFGDKAGLYGAVASRLGSMMWESAQVTIVAAREAVSVDDMIRSSVRSYVALVDEHPVVIKFLMTNQMFQYSESGDGGAAEQLRSVMEIVADRFADCLRRVDADVSAVPMAVASILGSGLSATQWWIDIGRELGLDDEAFAAHLVQTTWGIIQGSAKTIGVSFSPNLPFGDPNFVFRI